MQFNLVITTGENTISSYIDAMASRSGVVFEGRQCLIDGLQALGGTLPQDIPCDMFADETVKLSRQVKDLRDIKSVFTDYTQEFELPTSKTNDQLFSNYFEENAYLDGWNPFLKLDAAIHVHSLPVFEGVIELVSVNFKDALPRSYRVIFYGKTKLALAEWAEKNLSDLDWSAYNHTVNITNIIDSWTGSLFSGDILYPVVDWYRGFTYSSQYHVPNNLADARSGMQINDMRPALKLKAMIQTCFQDFGDVGGTLLDKTEFNTMFCAPMSEAGALRNPTNQDAAINVSETAFTATFNTFTKSSKNVISFNTVTSDPLGVWSTSTYTYTAPFNGDYTFQFTCDIVDLSSGTPITYQGTTYALEVDGVKTNQTKKISTIGLVTYEAQVNLDAGQEVQMVCYSRYCDMTNLSFQATQVPSGINGTTLNMGDIMPPMKISDFVNSVLQTFNAIVIPNADGGYDLHNIDDWYEQGNTTNWTPYANLSNITHEKTPIPAQIKLNHAEGKDRASVNFKNQFVREFGGLQYKPDVDFSAAPFELRTPFNIMTPALLREVGYQSRVIGTTDLQIPNLIDDAGKNVQQQWTLFYYVELAGTNYPYYLDGIQRTTIPLISPYSAYPTTSSDYSLAFGLEATISGDMPTNTIYQRFYARYFSRLYSTQSRIVKIAAEIPVGEWLNLNLNDTVAISGNYYKIQRIEYDMLKEQAALELISYPDVELIQITSSLNNGGWTNASTGDPDGVTVLNGDYVGRDITNTHTFGGTDYTGATGGEGVYYNTTNLSDAMQTVLTLPKTTQKAQKQGFLSTVPTSLSVLPDGSYVLIPFDEVVGIGDHDRLSADLVNYAFSDIDGGVFRITAMAAFDHSGGLDLQMTVLHQGEESMISTQTFSDKGPVTITGLISLGAGDLVQVGLKDLRGHSHTIDIQDFKFFIETC